jgi:excisionase family DNA binding protein
LDALADALAAHLERERASLVADIAEIVRGAMADLASAQRVCACRPDSATSAGGDRWERVSRKEAAIMLRVSESTVDRLRKDGVIRACPTGSRVFFRRVDIERYRDRREPGCS